MEPSHSVAQETMLGTKTLITLAERPVFIDFEASKEMTEPGAKKTGT